MFDQHEAVKAERLTELVRAMGAEAGDGRACFVQGLYRHGAAEDLATYSVDALDALAADAWRHFQERQVGTHRIRVFDPDGVPDLAARHLTVVEIVNDDMPFLFRSVLNELQARGLAPLLVLHPIFSCRRDNAGHLVELIGLAEKYDAAEHDSLIHIHVPRIEDATMRAALIDGLDAVMKDLRLAVTDWGAMRRRLREVVARYEENPPRVQPDMLRESIELLDLLADSLFIFLGIREYRLDGSVDEGELVALDGRALGILRDPSLKILRRGTELVTMTAEIRQFLKQPEPLIITKANVRARVHRRAHMDYVGAKIYHDDASLAGELRIVGLFTSDAYTRSVLDVPYLRGKVRRVMERMAFDPRSHSGKTLLNLLETYPRDELFQIDDALLHRFALAILQLDERPRIRVLPRIDKFDRFVSILIFVPRDRFNTQVREAIEHYFATAYDGHVSTRYIHFGEGPLTRLHLIIGRTGGETPTPDPRELEQAVADIVRTWQDDLMHAATVERTAALSPLTVAAYADAFAESYRATYRPEQALRDIRVLERIGPERPTAIAFFQRTDTPENRASLKIYNLADPISLSSRVPILEAMGFVVINERTFQVQPVDGRAGAYIHDMTLARRDDGPIDMPRLADPLQSMFMSVWRHRAESDGYNALLLNAGIGWRDVAMLRALSRYLQQAGIPFAQDFMSETLNRYPQIAAALVRLFYARFDPGLDADERERRIGEAESALAGLVDAVESLNDDTIVRRFQNLVEAGLRTSFFQIARDGAPVETLAFKFEPAMITALPKPHPYREVWVYSPRVEGVHLRFGPVARGGLRWTDRPQDFRTEILGLVKAQQVKNAVIVPVGAKGGFYPKMLPSRDQREPYFNEGRAAYEIFVSTLLDITDNLDGGAVVPPHQVLRRDGDDPYLVVAADKGTATFSDTANAISEARGFWLGDAFASGGSAGYDHKAMGITARGAWEAVKRHFREMDRDIQTSPFTCIGIGDMSGDVFGNGMLLSRQTKLIAAFNHLNIFIDPDPDPAASWAERKRLFDLPRSSWTDYDRSVLSQGGGIYDRGAKSVDLSARARAMLGLEAAGRLTPQDVIRAVLRAEADLLWFGGIGTYVRASDETNADVGDKANDAIRCTAKELRAAVIGEGANLGMTQKARIEFNLLGGRCNSDAIDNSAGVNTSDVEVNIKIALNAAERAGLIDREARNRLLVEMTDEVAALVLRNNYLQTLAISLSERAGTDNVGYQIRLMNVLEQRGDLDRALEFLPVDSELLTRAAGGRGLTRAEIGVLLAYAKITLYNDLLASAVPDDPYLGREIGRYFPDRMEERFAAQIQAHRLRREIIATMLSNSMINRGGPTFIVRVTDQTGASVEAAAQSFAATRDSFRLTELNEEINALDNEVPGGLQLMLYAAVRALTIDGTVWFIRNCRFQDGIAAEVERFRAGIAALEAEIDDILPETEKERIATLAGEWIEAGVPAPLAERIARLPAGIAYLDIIVVSERCGVPLRTAGHVFLLIGHRFRIGRLEQLARRIDTADYYDELALDRARRTLEEAHRRIASNVLTDTAEGAAEAMVEAWIAAHEDEVRRTLAKVQDIAAPEALSVSRLTVAANLLSDLAAAAG